MRVNFSENLHQAFLLHASSAQGMHLYCLVIRTLILAMGICEFHDNCLINISFKYTVSCFKISNGSESREHKEEAFPNNLIISLHSIKNNIIATSINSLVV